MTPAHAQKSSGGKSGGGAAGPASTSSLEDQLGPLGRSALAILQGGDSHYKQAEEFLDKAGIIGSLRRPFLAPFELVYRRGASEVEHVVADHWSRETLSPIAQLLSRFPFNQGAEREVAPNELDLLNETSGSFWKDVHVPLAELRAQVDAILAAWGMAAEAAVPPFRLATP